MRLLLLCLLLMVWIFSACAQQAPTTTQQAYLLKSHHQKTAATVLLIGGGALLTTILIVSGPSNENSFDSLPFLAAGGAVGGLAMLGSIPLFTAAAGNKRKAGAALTLQLEARPAPLLLSPRLPSYPAVAICLRH
jgi:hypothetical protein